MWTIIKYALGLLAVFSYGAAGGAWLHHRWYGEVRIMHNILIVGDPLNYGQESIDIEFPVGVKLAQIKLPYGGFYPDERPRRVKILPDGTHQDWLGHLSFETYDWGTIPASPPKSE